jgi:hypothetical protein
MRLHFPKSNVAWTVIDGEDDFRSFGYRGDVTIRAEFQMPKGERVYVENRFDRMMLERAKDGFSEHVIDRTLQQLEREVGRKMVRG